MKTILIADDNPESLYMLEFLLKSNGYKVETASNGDQALLRAHQHPPDMIITDILMPETDGYLLCREWMKNNVLRHIPFIFYTATYTDPRDEEFAMNLGASKFILKPKEPVEFLKIINEVIEKYESGQAQAPKEPITSEAIYLKEYNQALIRKLEDKMLVLEKTNQALKQEIERRKKNEECIRVSLEEKKVLLKEIHHRVKNNLQIIISLLDLQAAKIKNSQALESLGETKNRVYSMALIHDKLYQSQDFSKIDFGDFLDTITLQLFQVYNKEKRISLQPDIQKIHLEVDNAVPCGLIANELLTNAFTHAFPGKRQGQITISFREKDRQTYELIVRDNGVGLPGNVNYHEAESIGLQLVKGLVDQIAGSLEIKRETPGTKVVITFHSPPS